KIEIEILELEKIIVAYKNSKLDSALYYLTAIIAFITVMFAVVGLAVPILISKAANENIGIIKTMGAEAEKHLENIKNINEEAESAAGKLPKSTSGNLLDNSS
ncbi:MAG: hypothetical protein HAW64_02680, partial [Alphaproteobacteria bacterium]|nr:hypothetical protein [Alphaproteobacteria bacterium]